MHSAHLPMRPIVIMIVLALPGLAGAAVASASEPSTQVTTVMGTQSLNLRSCPDVGCELITSIPLGTSVQVTGASVNGFAPVQWNGNTGWGYDLFLLNAGEDPLVRKGVPGCNRVALIFNAGIGEAPSQDILDTLISTQTPVTLFAMGWWAETYPDYLRSMADANVVVGSHGNTQTLLTVADDVRIGAEVLNSATMIQSVTGAEPVRYYTPYASDSDHRVRWTIAAHGYLPVSWTVAAGDYHADSTAEAVYSRVMGGVEDGAIIELHLDGPATDASTAQALPWIIADLEAQGYTLVTVPEIILPCG